MANRTSRASVVVAFVIDQRVAARSNNRENGTPRWRFQRSPTSRLRFLTRGRICNRHVPHPGVLPSKWLAGLFISVAFWNMVGGGLFDLVNQLANCPVHSAEDENDAAAQASRLGRRLRQLLIGQMTMCVLMQRLS